MRALANGPYSKDVLNRDGTRTLFFDKSYKPDPQNTQNKQNKHGRGGLRGFHATLLAAAPKAWKYVRLTPSGQVSL